MTTFLQLTTHDPLVARDGRPFGAGQGNRMRGLPWLLPSVVAGSFRSALVKSNEGLDFTADVPERLLQIEVAGVFPVHGHELYLPAPNDAVAESNPNSGEIQFLHRTVPQTVTGGCDLPDGLQPVMLSQSQASDDFKPTQVPAWWPLCKYAEWLTSTMDQYPPTWFEGDLPFLEHPLASYRDHVSLNPERGAAEEGQLFSTVGLNLTHLPKFRVKRAADQLPFKDQFADVELSARVTIRDSEMALTTDQQFALWHPLGGERRMVHWKTIEKSVTGWKCPDAVQTALANTRRVRMILATPAIFKAGWKPDLSSAPLKDYGLKLIGAHVGRWKAVSGWSLAPPRGPKPIRRMVPAGSVYFFEVEKPGDAARLAELWLHPISDDEQEKRDGFGLAVWGIW